MKLSKQAIQEFAEIYQEEFGETISLEEAEIMAGRLLEFVSMVSRPPKADGRQLENAYE